MKSNIKTLKQNYHGHESVRVKKTKTQTIVRIDNIKAVKKTKTSMTLMSVTTTNGSAVIANFISSGAMSLVSQSCPDGTDLNLAARQGRRRRWLHIEST